MKAIVYHKNGSIDVLKLEEIEKPVPKDVEVLIKVRAASVNPFDYHMLRHRFLRRVLAMLAKIETNRPGRDVAGHEDCRLPIANWRTVASLLVEFHPAEFVSQGPPAKLYSCLTQRNSQIVVSRFPFKSLSVEST